MIVYLDLVRLEVDLPHPRDTQSDAFRDIERRIYADLDEELVRSFAQEGSAVGG